MEEAENRVQAREAQLRRTEEAADRVREAAMSLLERERDANWRADRAAMALLTRDQYAAPERHEWEVDGPNTPEFSPRGDLLLRGGGWREMDATSPPGELMVSRLLVSLLLLVPALASHGFCFFSLLFLFFCLARGFAARSTHPETLENMERNPWQPG